MITDWEAYITDYLAGNLAEATRQAFKRALAESSELREEVRIRQLEADAIERFYAYYRDQPDYFPDQLPGTKLYFAGLFTAALFLGTFEARTCSEASGDPTRQPDKAVPPGEPDHRKA